MKKKILGLILAALLVLSLCPMTVFADAGTIEVNTWYDLASALMSAPDCSVIQLTADVSYDGATGIYVSDTKILNLGEYSISGTSSGGSQVDCVISLNNGSSLIIDAGTGSGITGGKTGIYVSQDSYCQFLGGSINYNTLCGVDNCGTFSMEDGSISNNGGDFSSSAYDGLLMLRGIGVFNESGASFSMKSGKIRDNTAYNKYVYGVGVYNEGNFTMNDGCSIVNNTASSDNGASSYGGGITNVGVFTMNGGTISFNTADYGGGVYNNGNFFLYAGKISSNHAEVGAGVYNSSTININGECQVVDNTTSDSLSSNIYLDFNPQTQEVEAIFIQGSYTADNTKLGISVTPDASLPVNVVNGIISEDYLNFITSDDNSIVLTYDTEGYIVANKPAAEYTVIFDAQGIGEAPNEQIVKEGEKVTEPEALTSEGSVFGGWFKDAECLEKWDFENDVVTEDTVLYAKWTALPPTSYTVRFNHLGLGEAPAEQQVTEGGKVTEPEALTSEGSVFGGWFKDPECLEKWDFENDVVTEDITLYAKWTALPPTPEPEPDPVPETGDASSAWLYTVLAVLAFAAAFMAVIRKRAHR